MRLVVRVPRLVAAIGFAVASDLSVDTLEALPDPGSDRLHRFTISQTVSDLDPVILADEPVTDRGLLEDVHAASVDKPQRATAQRHADLSCGLGPGMTPPNQCEVLTFDLRGHLVRSEPRHRDLPLEDSRRSLEIAGSVTL